MNLAAYLVDPSRFTRRDLRLWRTARGMTQAELAGYLGVSRLTYQQWERGRYRIPRLLPLALRGLESLIERRVAA
jgi:transcriptional regulator with XRE-family HTH domain